MAELGPDGPAFHAEIGALVRERGIGPLIGVGELAPRLLARPVGRRRRRRGAAGRRRAPRGGRGPGQGLALGRPRAPQRRARGAARRGRRVIATGADRAGCSTVAVDRGAILIAGMAAMLITIFLGPKFIEKPARARVRPADPRGGPAGTSHEGGHPDDGRADHLRGDLGPLPRPLRPRHREPGGLRRRARQRRDRLRRRLHQDHQAAFARALGALEAARFRSPSPWSSGGSPSRRSASTRACRSASSVPSIYLGPVVYVVLSFLVLAGASNGVNLTDGLDGLAAGCCAIVFLSYLAITITTGQEDLALLVVLLRRRLGRVPLVQRLPGDDLHGGYGIARPRRRDRAGWRS